MTRVGEPASLGPAVEGEVGRADCRKGQTRSTRVRLPGLGRSLVAAHRLRSRDCEPLILGCEPKSLEFRGAVVDAADLRPRQRKLLLTPGLEHFAGTLGFSAFVDERL